jgi:hypothetical protein
MPHMKRDRIPPSRPSASRQRAVVAVAPDPGNEPGKSNGEPHYDLDDRWQVFVPLGQPVCFWAAREIANDVPLAFVVPVRRAA